MKLKSYFFINHKTHCVLIMKSGFNYMNKSWHVSLYLIENMHLYFCFPCQNFENQSTFKQKFIMLEYLQISFLKWIYSK